MEHDTMRRCPECDEPVESDAINIREGVAMCAKCGTLSRLSELMEGGRSRREIITRPPNGCAIDVSGHTVVVTASMRSVSGFVGAVAISLFWNGIVSVFVLLALGGLYANLIGPLPDWFPVPGTKDGIPQMNDGPMGLGMTLFLCLFLTPFVTIGAGMIGTAVMNLCGRIRVVIDESGSYVATGVAWLEWMRKFDAREVRSVGWGEKKWQSEGGSNRLIEMAADRTLKFGSMLPPERMEWLRTVLGELLLTGASRDRQRVLPGLPWLRR